MENEIKNHSGIITECKQEERNGVPVGVVIGSMATWDVDQGKDQYVKGAFTEHLDQYKAEGKKFIPLTDAHGRPIGGFPIDSMIEDDKGLQVRGEINLDIQQGREAYALVKQGVYDSFSTEYKAEETSWEGGIRKITKSKLWGGAILPHPMNKRAVITEVKDDEEARRYSIKEINSVKKSDLVKIFKGVLSADAANYVASLVMTADAVDKNTGDPVKMLNELADTMKHIKESIR